MKIAEGLLNQTRPPRHRLHRRRRRTAPLNVFSATIFRLRPRLEVMEDRTLLSTFVVSNTGDTGAGSFRQAIIDSNAAIGTTNTIDFNISGPGVQTIALLSPLPTITTAVVIDGYSQPGASPNTDAESDDAVLQVVLDGTTAGYDIDGLAIAATAVSVRGLVIDNFFGYGIHLLGSSGQDVIAGNFIGVGASGNFAQDNFSAGILVDNASWNTIGGTSPADRNIISGNYYGGVELDGALSSGNVVDGNFIGTDATGTAPPVSAFSYGGGVALFDGASGNLIGGTSPGAGNVISANNSDGVDISGTGNLIEGNLIGTDVTGTLALGNNGAGVELNGVGVDGGSSGNTVGGTGADAGNLIADNLGSGVAITGKTSVGDLISGNRIFGNDGPAIDLGTDGATNAPAPRQGPNQLQNFPVLVKTADGQLEGWLGGSTPNTLFQIQIFASAGLSANGLGEAEAYLGSLAVTTDSQGQAVFVAPFVLPTDKPVVTATATDPDGNTSEVSGLRNATLLAPEHTLHLVPGQPLIFSTASGVGIALDDADAGPLEPGWDLTLSVSSGTLTLSSIVGLTGSGDGTGSLLYRGPLAALDAALQGMIFNPSAGPDSLTTFTLGAQSFGTPPLKTQFLITDGVFVVDTTADSGPGSLRQAILDADSVNAGTLTIDFAIPGAGVQTIEPITPLPPITASVLIDGTTQPGFAGTPLIAFGGASTGSPLVIADGDITLRGLAMQSVAIDPTTNEALIAGLGEQGVVGQLSLIDSRGGVIVQSQGVAAGDANHWINEYPSAGAYSLAVTALEGIAAATWTIMLRQGDAPFGAISVDPGPIAIVAGDFTGDGHLDLATANWNNSRTISVVLGNGDGTFQPAVSYTVGNGPDGIVAGDFNGDGHLDLAVSTYSSDAIAVLLGNGDGTFRHALSYAVGNRPDAIAAGDFTGDGHLDLAVSDSDGVQIMPGNADGTFQPARTVAAGIEGPVVAGDFTGDGHLDLAVADSNSNTVSVLLGDGDGTFQPRVTYAVGGSPDAIVAGEFTDEGHLDLAVANSQDGTISVLLGNGDGTFRPQVPFAVGAFPAGMVAGDFSGDGRLDLAFDTGVSGTVSVLVGNGDGTFRPPVTSSVGASAYAVVAGHFNGDGRLDLAVADFGYSISVLLGEGDGTFQSQAEKENPVEAGPSSVVAGDFTGDGRLDLAVANEFAGTISVLLGIGDGTFQPQITYAVGNDPSAVIAGDFNGDGRLDLAVANAYADTISVLLGNGDGTFQPQVVYAVETDPNSIVAGEFNGDGHLDLAVANEGSNTVSVLLGNGDGTFQRQVTYAAGNEPFAMVTGAFTADGHPDLAVADIGSNTISVLLGNGDGTFQSAVTYTVGNAPVAIVAGDFTSDGRKDLVVLNDAGIQMLLGNGDGTFQAANTVAAGIYPLAIFAGDLAGDGRLDLAFTNPRAGTIAVLLGNGDGTFQSPAHLRCWVVPIFHRGGGLQWRRQA